MNLLVKHWLQAHFRLTITGTLVRFAQSLRFQLYSAHPQFARYATIHHMLVKTASCFLTMCSWLIAMAYWLAGGFIKSGLGNRIAYGIVSAFGSTTLGLVYSLVFAEALLSPAIPSVAARAGTP